MREKWLIAGTVYFPMHERLKYPNFLEENWPITQISM